MSSNKQSDFIKFENSNTNDNQASQIAGRSMGSVNMVIAEHSPGGVIEDQNQLRHAVQHGSYQLSTSEDPSVGQAAGPTRSDMPSSTMNENVISQPSQFVPQYGMSSISRGYNKVTGPGVTVGEPEDSSLINSQTNQGIREIDIDVEVGGFVSNMSYSSNVRFPNIAGGAPAQGVAEMIVSPKGLRHQVESPSRQEGSEQVIMENIVGQQPFLPQINKSRNREYSQSMHHPLQILQNMKIERNKNMLDQIDRSKFGAAARQSGSYYAMRKSTNPDYMYLDEGDVVNFSTDNRYEMKKDKSIQRITARNFNEKSIDSKKQSKKMKSVMIQEGHDYATPQDSGTRRKRAIKFEPEMFMSLNGLKNNPWSKKKNKVESYANLENQSSTRSIMNRGLMRSVDLSRNPSIAIYQTPKVGDSNVGKSTQTLQAVNQLHSLKSLTSAGSPSNWNLMSSATGAQKSDTNHSLYVGEEEILDDLRRIALKKMIQANSLRNKKPSRTFEPTARKPKLTLAEQERVKKEEAEKISSEEQLQKLDLRFPKMKEFHEYEAELLQIRKDTYDDARAKAQQAVDEASVVARYQESQSLQIGTAQQSVPGAHDDRYYKLYVPKTKKMPITEEAAYENENDETESQYTRKSGTSYNLKISSASKSQTKSQFGANKAKRTTAAKRSLSKPAAISMNSIASRQSSPSPSNSVSGSSSRQQPKPQVKRQGTIRQPQPKKSTAKLGGPTAKSNMNLFGLTSPLKAGSGEKGKLGGLVPTKKMTQLVHLDYQASDMVDGQMEEVEVRGMRALQRIKGSEFEPDNVGPTRKRAGKATKYDNKELLERYEQYKRETQQQLRVYDNFRKKIMQSSDKKRQTSEDKANFLVKQILLEKYLNSDELNGKYNLKKEIVDLANMESGLVELFDYKPPLRGRPAEPANPNSPIKDYKRASVNEYINFLTHGQLSNQVVFEFARQLKSNLGTDLVSKFNMKSLNLIDSLVQNVIQRVKFKDMISGTSYDDGLSKQVNEVVEQQNLQTTHKAVPDKSVDLSNFNPILLSQQQYISQARNHKTLALPIMQKIYQKNLTLVDYQLSKGHCQALKEAFKSNPKMINTLFIDQSTNSEEHNRLLLEGLAKLEKLYSLTIKNTELGHESIGYISEIIRKPFPNALLELRIVNCKLSLVFQESLFEYLCRGTSLLNTLALINAGFTQETVRLLCRYLDKHNSYLRHLDISCNELPSPHYYRPVLRLLAGYQAECDEEDAAANSHSHLALESINLSTNSLFDGAKNKTYMEKHPAKDEEDTSNNYELELTQLLSLTFQSNQTLTHFDLSNCGLSELIIYEILTFIKGSPTLTSIHLSNNPGIGATSMPKFAGILDCQIDEKKEYNIHFQEADQKKDYEPEGQYDQILSAVKREQLQARRICKDKQVQLSVNEGQYTQSPMAREAHSNPTFLLHRKLGHDHEFAYKASSWRLNINSDRDCWVCDRHIFSLLFWNEQIGDLMNTSLKNEKEIMLFIKRQNVAAAKLREEKQKAREQELLQMKRSGKYNQIVVCDEIERPVLYASNDNWEARDLLTLSEYCFLIDSRKTKRMKKLRYTDIKDYENAGPQQKARDNFDKDLYDLLQFYVAGPSTWRQVLHKNLEYRDPQFINTSTLCLHSMADKARNPTTFVLPQFLQAGRYSYVIEFKGKQYFHKGVIHYRQEAVPVRIAEASKGADEREAFNYKNSIFSEWREDIQSRLTDCLQHDLKYTRLDTFIKFSGGPEATRQQDLYNIQEGVLGLIQQNFVALKYAYVIALSQSNQIQGIDLDSMSLYVTKICRIHNHVNADNLKDAFQATVENFQGGQENSKRDQYKDARFLCRKEFIELFIRIGMIEYPDLKASESFEKVLKYILRANEVSDSWQDFRDDQLWTEECHNIFEANRHELHAVFLKYSQRQSTQTVKNPKKKEQMVIGWNQMRKIFMQDSVPAVSNDAGLVLKASVLSKCTVPTDFEKGGQAMKMAQFEFVEFLEIIARVADLKTRGTHQQNHFLHKKIELVLSQILLINGDTKIKRQLPNLRITYQSTSELEELMRENLGKSLGELFKKKTAEQLAKSLGSSVESSVVSARGSIDTEKAILENESVIREAGADEEEEFNDYANKDKIKLEIHKRDSRTEQSIIEEDDTISQHA